MEVEQVLKHIGRTVNRWLRTSVRLKEDTVVGSNIIKVISTRRFVKGDEIIIRDSVKGETANTIDEVLDLETIRLTSNVQNVWNSSDNVLVEKTFNQTFLQAIYYGDISAAPKFPCVVIKAVDSSSEWMALQITKEKYNVEISVYVEDSSAEEGYFWMIRAATAIQTGLKKNINCLVGPYRVKSLTANIDVNDYFIKINSTQDLFTPAIAYLEDKWSMQEIHIHSVIDSDTLKLQHPVPIPFDKDESVVIFMDRWFFNSFPSGINYGKLFKGTMLKSATISWFCEETSTEFGLGEPRIM